MFQTGYSCPSRRAAAIMKLVEMSAERDAK